MSRPNTAGAKDIARQIARGGKAHLCIIGDSIAGNSGTTPGQIAAINRVWRVPTWAGVVTTDGGLTEQGYAHFSTMSNPNTGTLTPTQFGTASTTNLSAMTGGGYGPKTARRVVMNGNTVEAEVNYNTNRIVGAHANENVNPALYFHAGDWINGNAITARPITYRDSTGHENLIATVRRGTTNVTSTTSVSLSNATPGVYSDDYAIGGTGSSTAGALFFYRHPGGATTVSGDHVTMLGVRFYRPGVTGFQLDFLGQAGGYQSSEYLDTAQCSDANWNGYHQAADNNVFMLWLGANDAGAGVSKATYKANIEAIIARCLGAIPAARFILVSPYELASPAYDVLDDYADALLEITRERSDCLFLNVYDAAGSYTFLNGSSANRMLSDGVHQTERGHYYFAGVTWSLIEAASVAASIIPLQTATGLILLESRG